MSAPRIGVLGGTFDPIHHGHLAAASEVCAALGLDRVLLVPTATQPFKTAGSASSDADRIAMLERVAAQDARLQVSRVDVDRGGITYTLDTLTDLREELPDAELFFITGYDALERFDEWKEPARLHELATFVGVSRPGHTTPDAPGPFVLVDVPAVDVSSTDVRRRVREGAPIRYLVPHCVADYIVEHDLYTGGRDD